MAHLGIVKHLIAYHGKDKHRHDFKIEMIFQGPIENGMVAGIDFHEIKPYVESKLLGLEGKYLPEIDGLDRATVENIAIYFVEFLKNRFPVCSVTVWEDRDRFARIYVEDLEKK